MGLIHLVARSALDTVEADASTFTSWDKCMAESYCKWPVIIAIVIASLIVFSVVWCCARCLCCGLSCCCSCFQCFSCFECCCPSSGRRDRRSRRKGNQSSGLTPNPYHGYIPTPSAPPAYEPPRTAQFDASTKGGKYNDDSLPAMPSWDNAPTKKVENHTPHEDLEMNNMDKRASAISGSYGGGRGRYSQLGASPISPYAEPPDPYRAHPPTHAYDGDIGSQQARPQYDYPAPALSQQSLYQPQQPQQAQRPFYQSQQPSYGSQHTSPVSQQPPQGGFRAPASEDQFQPSAIAPTPQQFSTGYTGYTAPSQPQHTSASYSGASSTRYEPSSHYGQQETGVTQVSPTSGTGTRPPSILQAGRKPVANSWRDV